MEKEFLLPKVVLPRYAWLTKYVGTPAFLQKTNVRLDYYLPVWPIAAVRVANHAGASAVVSACQVPGPDARCLQIRTVGVLTRLSYKTMDHPAITFDQIELFDSIVALAWVFFIGCCNLLDWF